MDRTNWNPRALCIGICILESFGCSFRQTKISTAEQMTSSEVKSDSVTAPTPEEKPAPEFNEASPMELDDRIFFVQSSSTHRDVNEHSFQPSLLFDDDLQTCWQEGNPSVRGEREFVTIYFEVPVDISQIRVATGCQRAPDADGDPFEMNPRPRQIIGVSNKDSRTVMELEDSRGLQSHDVDLQGVQHLTLQIQSVYEGRDWTDGAISEVSFTGRISSEPMAGSWAPGIAQPDGGGIGTGASTLMSCMTSKPFDHKRQAQCIENFPLQIWQKPLNLSKLESELPEACTLKSLADAVGRSTTQHVRVGRLRSNEDARAVDDVWPLTGVGYFSRQDFEYSSDFASLGYGHSFFLVLRAEEVDLETAWRFAYACAGVQDLVKPDISALPVKSAKGTGLLPADAPPEKYDGYTTYEWEIKTNDTGLRVQRIDPGGYDFFRYVDVKIISNTMYLSAGENYQ